MLVRDLESAKLIHKNIAEPCLEISNREPCCTLVYQDGYFLLKAPAISFADILEKNKQTEKTIPDLSSLEPLLRGLFKPKDPSLPCVLDYGESLSGVITADLEVLNDKMKSGVSVEQIGLLLEAIYEQSMKFMHAPDTEDQCSRIEPIEICIEGLTYNISMNDHPALRSQSLHGKLTREDFLQEEEEGQQLPPGIRYDRILDIYRDDGKVGLSISPFLIECIKDLQFFGSRSLSSERTLFRIQPEDVLKMFPFLAR